MNLAVVQKEVATWSQEEQDQLFAYLAALRRKRDSDYPEELSRRLDDKTAENWLTLDDLKKRLGED